MLRGRRITTLRISNLMNVEDADDFEALTASVMPITTLTFDVVPGCKESAFRSIGTYMKDVQHLVLDHAEVWMLPWIIKELLPPLRSLRTLRLLVWHYSTAAWENIEATRANAFTDMQSICPQLEDLEIKLRWP
ncbi:hypothetical protein FRB93_006290 [Tulasnella sp. JGI-2019a]|nr:hypothetical protein FRB93_006290 [Tulasnella sp. JGI-2019a]